MTAKRQSFFDKIKSYDWVLIVLILLLVSLGLLSMFSATSYIGNVRHGDGYYYVKEQLAGIILGFAAMIFFMVTNYKRWRRKFWPIVIYAVCIIALLLCFIPRFQAIVWGAKRWIKLGGRTFQPAEFAKYGLIVFLGAMLARQAKGDIKKISGLLILLVPVGAIALIMLKQPDYSTLLITVLAYYAMLIVAGMKSWHIVLTLVVGLVAGFVMLQMEDYRVNRLVMFRDPFDPETGSDQLRQALYAIASGGFWGQGIGNSKQKFMFLPQQESDFIMSIIVEETGFIGCFLIITLFFLLIWRGFRIASRCRDPFGRFVATGITTLLGLQAFINIGVAMVAIPPTGLTLPFFSFGSSSLLCTLAAMGLLLSISRYGSETLPQRAKSREKAIQTNGKPASLEYSTGAEG